MSCRRRCIGDRSKRSEDAITCVFENASVPLSDDPGEDLVMSGEGVSHDVGLRLPQDSAGFDVREQECDLFGAHVTGREKLCVVYQDPLLELSELRSGLDPQLICEILPRRGVCPKRLGLPSCPIERDHVPAPEPFTERELGSQSFQLADHSSMPAIGEIGIDSRFDGKETECFQPPNLVLEPRHIDQVCIWSPTRER